MALVLVFVVGLVAISAERLWPARPLRRVPNWWTRVLALNLAQVGVVLLVGAWLDPWLARSGVGLGLRTWSPWAQGGLTYLVSCALYYGWHRARHESPLLWRWLHQTHHAPERLEVAMAFYKHPLEAGSNALISSALAFGLMGCSPEGAAIYTLLAGTSELFYHLNLRTPHWVGYLIQRPEMHRIHHQRGHHANNYADLAPIDMLFGTWHNPRPEEGEVVCGLGPELEDRFEDQLLARDLEDVEDRPPAVFLPAWIGAEGPRG
ncbi:MAG: sterol desaturase family protein [Planctomycetes bacterium]|nr:sterol desaturase family protein [Planctomycetota bacterium]